MRRLLWTLLGIAILFAGITLAPKRAGAAELPVPYHFLLTATTSAMQPDADPPGANDWTCRPSAAHPTPVVLVHGLLANKNDNWQTFAPLLKNNGYCVYALTYGTSPYEPAPYDKVSGGLAPIEQSAGELGTFVARVLAATGAAKVDILGHSEGTIVPNYYAKFLGGAKYIDQYIGIAPIWHGTSPAGLSSLYALAKAFGFDAGVDGLLTTMTVPSLTEMLASSDFITKFRSGGGPAVAGIRYTNIVTRYDELVVPYTSGIEPGMTNYVLQDVCPLDFSEHLQIASSPNTAQIVLNTLDPAHATPVRCRLVLPL